ncbi:hypothetical protein BBG47_20030 [Paenibacillus sp. KS1]|uniref:hypothetical protein n=1 Tax=Paenibacillus sp. KS1 TaxID=1849249 RepID=UPI0008065D02|nr:hypothetical protein [Paenibacillus sp. KS1]OBY77781.1 hypothetical protein BBG47_20030 [Paenibacillus sp. KS1]
MQIGVYGHTDKRPVIYALMKLLQATGDVALFSNHRHYKRLLEHGESQGHMVNIMIAVSDASPDEIFEEIGYTVDDFEHIIYDLQDTIPENLSLVIYVKSYPPGEEEQSILDLIGDYHTIKMTYDGRREKGAINVSPISLIWKRVEEFEAFHILAPMPSNDLNKGLAKLIAPSLKMTSKTAFKLLTRRWDK